VPDLETELGPDTKMSLRQALAHLPETDRLMLTLFYVEGLRGTEIAAALGIPLGTVKSRLFTARQKLKTIYEAEIGD
jgi:RNA polymerase sigma-70 factor (ECF subfamily)